ncbi:MAG: ankyrin repeat domain-containing protein [Ktedonobacterales bacterium]
MEKRSEALEPTLVQAIVANAHGDLAKVTELLNQESKLVNAAWDWGGGDWETPLGAAAHTGQREIAHYLLDHGARIDLFAAAMLGRLEVVQAMLAAFPDALHTPGPHGIPLIAHARMGGAEAAPVLAWLESLAATNNGSRGV